MTKETADNIHQLTIHIVIDHVFQNLTLSENANEQKGKKWTREMVKVNKS
jgi:hypothetical protein